jgi:hypothetical protein
MTDYGPVSTPDSAVSKRQSAPRNCSAALRLRPEVRHFPWDPWATCPQQDTGHSAIISDIQPACTQEVHDVVLTVGGRGGGGRGAGECAVGNRGHHQTAAPTPSYINRPSTV